MGGKDVKGPIFLVFGILLSPVSLLLICDGADGIGAPAIQIILDQAKQTANVEQGSDNMVTFTGVVRAQAPYMPPGQHLIVTLETDAGGWVTSAPPSLMFTNDVDEQPFSISVQVPTGTSQRTQGQLIISGRWRYSPGTLGGNIDPATAIIIIAQYFSYEVAPYDPIAYVEENSGTDVIFTVMNQGNGPDTIALEVVNHEELENLGITARPKFDEIKVPEYWGVHYPVSFICSSRTQTGTYEIEVAIHSILAEDQSIDHSVEETIGYVEVLRMGAIPAPEPDIDNVPTGEDNEHPISDTGSPEGSEDHFVLNTILLAILVAVLIFITISYAFIIFIRVIKRVDRAVKYQTKG